MINETLFISDLHLQADRPDITHVFFKFLEQYACSAEALYILGDLFEFWIGDDEINPFHQKIIDALNELHQYQTPVYFIHGNRDFLVGKKFCKLAKIILLPDPTVIELYGQRVLLTHGDYLCTDDIKHQRFRRITQNKLLQWMFLHSPIHWRRNFAMNLRQKSELHQKNIDVSITDVNDQAVTNFMEKYQVTRMIHGHTHRPAIHNFIFNNQSAQRIVLSDWHQQGSALRYYSNGEYQLFYFT